MASEGVIKIMLDVKNITISKGNSINSSRRFTFYYPSDSYICALIVYIHGGGLLCGNAKDLPELHKEKLTDEGYAILAIDYPLAPQAKIDDILEDIIDSINNCFELTELRSDLPLFVWGDLQALTSHCSHLLAISSTLN